LHKQLKEKSEENEKTNPTFWQSQIWKVVFLRQLNRHPQVNWNGHWVTQR